MPDSTDSPIRKTVSLPANIWQQIEDYQFGKRLKRETEAIRQLIELGLQAAKAPPPPTPSRSAKAPG